VQTDRVPDGDVRAEALRSVLLLSLDLRLRDVVARAVGAAAVYRCSGVGGAHNCLRQAVPSLVVIDDSAVDPTERGWLLEEVRRFAPGAFVVYVADRQDAELERQVRARGATYYTARPLDVDRLRRVLEALIERARAFVVAGGPT
jgi:DNA-binding NarL/FixJ family response regulator